jgi:protein-L-isoaspartate O-methyltransferase
MRASLQTAFDDVAREHQRALSSYRDGWGGWGNDAFPYIMLGADDPHSGFTRVLPFLKRGMRVVDVGCGAGDKLIRFHEAQKDLHVTGIEIDPVLAKMATYVTRPYRNINVIEGNAFAQDYSAYDLIYMYWPIPDSRRQSDLQQLCIQTMKSGARIIVFGSQRSSDYPSMPYMEGHNYNGNSCGWVKP